MESPGTNELVQYKKRATGIIKEMIEKAREDAEELQRMQTKNDVLAQQVEEMAEEQQQMKQQVKFLKDRLQQFEDQEHVAAAGSYQDGATQTDEVSSGSDERVVLLEKKLAHMTHVSDTVDVAYKGLEELAETSVAMMKKLEDLVDPDDLPLTPPDKNDPRNRWTKEALEYSRPRLEAGPLAGIDEFVQEEAGASDGSISNIQISMEHAREVGHRVLANGGTASEAAKAAAKACKDAGGSPMEQFEAAQFFN